jgi:nucleoside-diphosphate-sugar epimerase
MTERVLITGATGFIGRQCVPALIGRGYEVHGVSSKQHAGDSGDVHWHRADLLSADDTGALIERVRPSHLLHLAWYVEHGKFWNSPENFRWVAGSLQLVRAFAEAGGQRAVLAGTCGEYDWSCAHLSEHGTPLVPNTLYGACKHSLQLMVSKYAIQNALSVAWGRVFFLFGPHEHPGRFVPYVVQSLLQGRPALCSHGDQVREFLHVRDVAAAFVAILDSSVDGPVNISSGVPVTVNAIARMIGARLHKEHLLQFGARPTAANDPPRLTADVARLRDEVGWQPTCDLAGALEDTIRWWEVRFDAVRHSADGAWVAAQSSPGVSS